jgi:hypothetical protein
MNKPVSVACEVCGSPANMVMLAHMGAEGNRVEWPKAAVKADGIYFTIACPNCGEREQCVARHGDTD